MSYTLGIDIGTFESKGIIVDGEGRVVATASRPHKMLVPRPGWAEHRPKQDWWGDFVHICKAMLAQYNSFGHRLESRDPPRTRASGPLPTTPLADC